MFDDLLKHRSGRVIALARTVLATVFLFAIWVDPTQPTQAATATYAGLLIYLASAVALTVITWNNWWWDAKLAAFAQVVDIAVFTMLVFATDGYTSPFFVFFAFMVLSAAIRWGWRETAVTAAAVSLLYFTAGFMVGNVGPDFDLQRFIIRSGNLVILSALLIWFGVNHGFSGFKLPKGALLGETSPDESPLQSVVEGAARLTRASTALLLWHGGGSHQWLAVILQPAGYAASPVAVVPSRPIQRRPFLFDLGKDRAVARGHNRRIELLAAANLVDSSLARQSGIEEGLAVPVSTDGGEGMLLLGGIHGLCVDHIEFGEALSDGLSRHIQSHALLSAVEDGAIAKARLSLARDLHDSIVQFLAGATFRIEAISRAVRSGEPQDRELKDLKQLMLQEQQELRSAIGALRTERISLSDLAADVKALCDRMARQWDIDCRFSSEVPELKVPMRLHLDTHQLVREAVANAVRHAKARSVRVQLTVDDNDLRLDISNDGKASERLKEGSPWSLRERVDEANGTLMLASRKVGTSVSITLPLKTEQQL